MLFLFAPFCDCFLSLSNTVAMQVRGLLVVALADDTWKERRVLGGRVKSDESFLKISMSGNKGTSWKRGLRTSCRRPPISTLGSDYDDQGSRFRQRRYK